MIMSYRNICKPFSTINSDKICQNQERAESAANMLSRQKLAFNPRRTARAILAAASLQLPGYRPYAEAISVPALCLKEGLQYRGGGNSIQPFSFLASSKITGTKLSLGAETAQTFVLKVDRNPKVPFKLLGKVQNTPGLRAF